jgi:histidinol-phosphate aminotransferase
VQAQAASLAALSDSERHIAATLAMIKESKKFMLGVCDRLGLETVGGEGNYLMIRVPINDLMFYRKLMKRGMMVRTMTGFRFPGWIRVTLRERNVMELFSLELEAEINEIRINKDTNQNFHETT